MTNFLDDYNFPNYAGPGELIGKTITKIDKEHGDTLLYLETSDGEKYAFFHYQDCCESVYLEDVAGDLNDLIGNPILVAEEVHNDTMDENDDYGITRYTFYKLATIKGHVDLRFCGSSNGYYSVGVDFVKAK